MGHTHGDEDMYLDARGVETDIRTVVTQLLQQFLVAGILAEILKSQLHSHFPRQI